LVWLPLHCPDPLHVPVVQASTTHVASLSTGYEHAPPLQVPGPFSHGPGESQVTAVPLHTPDELHVSPVVQALPSLHGPPVSTSYEHVPPLQVPPF
jgi:hypothetical protein